MRNIETLFTKTDCNLFTFHFLERTWFTLNPGKKCKTVVSFEPNGGNSFNGFNSHLYSKCENCWSVEKQNLPLTLCCQFLLWKYDDAFILESCEQRTWRLYLFLLYKMKGITTNQSRDNINLSRLKKGIMSLKVSLQAQSLEWIQFGSFFSFELDTLWFLLVLWDINKRLNNSCTCMVSCCFSRKCNRFFSNSSKPQFS